jgi:hypothetical protein
MSLVDQEPGLILAVLLYLDSPAVFRTRRCSRAHANLFANGLKLWCDLLKGESLRNGSHTAKGGIWLPTISEDVLSLYVKRCSATKLATDLEFKDTMAVAGLQKASYLFDGVAAEDGVHGKGQPFKLGYVTRHGRPVCIEEQELISPLLSYVSKSQKFLGSWVFDSDSVRALLYGSTTTDAPRVVHSSSVEFRTVLKSGNVAEELAVQWGMQCQEEFAFGVQLMLSRTAGDRFVLSWLPVVTNASLCFHSLDIHLHGHVAVPFTFPLGYEGLILASSPTQTHIDDDLPVPVEFTLSKDDITEMLKHDCLNCALHIQLYQESQALPVVATTGCDVDMKVHWPQCTESGFQVDKEYKEPSVSSPTSVVAESQTDFLPWAAKCLSEMTICWLCAGIFFVTNLSEEGMSVLFPSQ